MPRTSPQLYEKLVPNDMYRNFFIRALSHASSLGADPGECFQALHDAANLTPKSWSTAWSKMASRLDEHAAILLAASTPQKVSARNAYLRASNYHRTAFAPFFGHPVDKAALMPSYLAMRASFSNATRLFDPPSCRWRLPLATAYCVATWETRRLQPQMDALWF